MLLLNIKHSSLGKLIQPMVCGPDVIENPGKAIGRKVRCRLMEWHCNISKKSCAIGLPIGIQQDKLQASFHMPSGKVSTLSFIGVLLEHVSVPRL